MLARMLTHVLRPNFGSYRGILALAGPLILSQTGVMVMHVIDGILLTRYSSDAVAAVGPASMSLWTILSLLGGLAGYCSTFVAQYVGAGRPERVGAAVWQGIYIALPSSLIMMAAALPARLFFSSLGHAPAVAEMEITFFRISCLGAPVFLLSAALSGFFAGRNDNVVLMAVQLAGTGVNAVLAWAMIFGRLGFPSLGMAGAAAAAIIANAIMVVCLAVLFLGPAHRRQYGTWADRAIDGPLLGRICRFGFPSGVRMAAEIMAWTLFVIFVGRVNALSLAASNIAWRINTLAFFPLMGLGMAISMLVGQAQGAGRPDLAERVSRRGLILAEVWELVAAGLFLAIPHTFLRLFTGSTDPDGPWLIQTGTVLLRFVALYCLMDAGNVILISALQGAGDTRWTLIATVLVYGLFLGGLIVIDRLKLGLYALWIMATAVVMGMALTWLVRFIGGKWKSMRVIEPAPADLG